MNDSLNLKTNITIEIHYILRKNQLLKEKLMFQKISFTLLDN
jgi:hypothetical protein